MLTRVGIDLSSRLLEAALSAEMQDRELMASWCHKLNLLDISFDSNLLHSGIWKFFAESSEDHGKDLNPCATQEDSVLTPVLGASGAAQQLPSDYARSLLPQLMRCSRADLNFALNFGHAQDVSQEEVVALWVEVCLTWLSEVGSSGTDEKGLPTTPCRLFYLMMPPVMDFLTSSRLRPCRRFFLNVCFHGRHHYDYECIELFLAWWSSTQRRSRACRSCARSKNILE